MKTWGKKGFEKKKYFSSEDELEKIYSPVIVPDSSKVMKKDNVVVIILESFSREFVGSLNKDINGGSYKGYTPFLDSLINESMVFSNAFANGHKSIDAIPSVTSSIPAWYCHMSFPNDRVIKLTAWRVYYQNKDMKPPFFTGLPTDLWGLMHLPKLQDFTAILARTNMAMITGLTAYGEFGTSHFPIFATELNKMKEPFATTIFSVSSHHPFKVPVQYEAKFPEGNIPLQKCIRYTDYSLKEFFDKAKTMPWYKNTLFVITADHCSEPDLKEYKTLVYDFAVPLIFHKPRWQP